MIRIDDTPDPYGMFGDQPEMPREHSEDELRQQMEREYEMKMKFTVLSLIAIIVFILIILICKIFSYS